MRRRLFVFFLLLLFAPPPGLATLSVARKIARRCYHTLRELGDQALQPAA